MLKVETRLKVERVKRQCLRKQDILVEGGGLEGLISSPNLDHTLSSYYIIYITLAQTLSLTLTLVTLTLTNSTIRPR